MYKQAMHIDDLKLLIKEGESLTVEFKEKYSTKIVQDIVAFANVKGGKIILGVTDGGATKGERLTNAMKAEIFSLARNCDPKIKVTAKQTGDYVVVDVPEGEDKPYSCSGAYYKRYDAVTQKLSQKETRAIFEDHPKVDYDEKPNREATIKDLALAKVKKFCKEAGIEIPVTTERLPNILRSLNLMNKGSISNAGVLFFANRMDDFFLHSQFMLLAFKDYEGVDIFDRREVRSDLLTQFKESEFFLERHLSLQAKIESMKRINEYEIPKAAWREAIANAIIHRDYRMSGTSIQIRVFPNRIEVISPGSLPEGVTIKNIGSMSSRRNEIIADMFARLDVIEKAGTGIIRIRKAMKAAGLKPPAFENMGKFFKIILYRPKGVGDVENVVGSVVDNVVDNVVDKMTENQREIYALIKANPKISAREIASKIKIATRNVQRNIEALKTLGLIKRIGTAKGGSWEIL